MEGNNNGVIEWDDGDRFSFEDSERFEEESICSWMSDTAESVCNNWRGWKKNVSLNPGSSPGVNASNVWRFPTSMSQVSSQEGLMSLVELAAKEVACNIPFEIVEHVFPPVPEEVQLRIAFWSFPENEEDIRLYSCLANGSADEFVRGENLLKAKAVKDMLQIGFHLSATVTSPSGSNTGGAGGTTNANNNNNTNRENQGTGSGTLASKGTYNVAVTFDRRRITSCDCTCSSSSSWCSHVVSVCLYRIHQPVSVMLRAPVSESLSRLERDQLQKFAQYLISELPQQILPTAQRLLDELLSSQKNSINTTCGAPDPTAGASAHEQTSWCLDKVQLHENIRKILIKFCMPSPIVFSDVNYLTTTQPPAAAEWTALLRPLRGREPEGMWNLLSIVREMFRRGDQNAIPLLSVLTEEVLACDQISIWWFTTRVSLHSGLHGNRAGVHSNSNTSQHACSSLCDEIVVLWRLACLNPRLTLEEKETFFTQMKCWHMDTLDKVSRWRSPANGRGAQAGHGGNNHNNNGNNQNHLGLRRADFEVFTGFKPALEACLLQWDDYPIAGVTVCSSRRWYCPFNHSHTHSKDTGLCRQNICQSTVKEQSSSCTSDAPSSSTAKVTDSKEQQIKGLLRGRGRSVEIGPCSEWRVTTTGGLMAPASLSPGATNCPSQQHLSSSSCTSFPLSSSPKTSVINDEECLEGISSHSSSIETNSRDNCYGKLLYTSTPSKNHENIDPIPEESSETDKTRENKVSDQPSTSSGHRDDSVPHLESNRSSFSSSSEGFCEENEGAVADVSLQIQPKTIPKQEELEEKAEASGGKDVNEDQPVKPEEPEAAAAAPPVPVAGPSAPGPSKGRPHKQSNHKNGDPFDLSIKKIEDKIEILFARAEALHAHGFTREACRLAVHLAEEMLCNPLNLMQESSNCPPRGKKARRFNPASHNISLMASATLSKAAFLCAVLTENPDNHHLAFKIGVFGLEMARPPASTKALEVKLANQEQDLVVLLKKIPLTYNQLQILREKGAQLRDGKFRSRGDALLPLTLAQYIFDSLVLSVGQASRSGPSITGRLQSDESIGFEAAVAALGLKANVSEADHPLLCEGTRRQRGELAATLLIYYKDNPDKLARIMDKLLDKEVHQMFKNAPPVSSPKSVEPQAGPSSAVDVPPASSSPTSSVASATTSVKTAIEVGAVGGVGATSGENLSSSNSDESLESRVIPDAAATGGLSCTYPRSQAVDQPNQGRTASDRRGSDEGPGSPGWDEGYKQWEAKFRCANLKTLKKHSVGMASIDSSAPETTSSDNSPTVVRRSLWLRPGLTGPPSDSGSSGDSSDSFGSSSSDRKKHQQSNPGPSGPIPIPAGGADLNSVGQKLGNMALAEPGSPSRNLNPPGNPLYPVSNNSSGVNQPNGSLAQNNLPGKSSLKFKGKRACPSIPNQPSEASAHFMFELAKSVLTKAGGSSSQAVLFTQQSSNNPHRGPHPALHMCAFQIGVYALGLHNAVSPNWLSRTYSSHVSWITGQAMEIGAPAINFLIETWEGHLTPPEVCGLADRASRNSGMVRAAAKLALSCLPHAQALNPNEIQRALLQCKEQSNELLEQACLAVESAAKGGGVYPEVLFEVARKWFEMYEESVGQSSNGASNGGGNGRNNHNNNNSSNRNAVQASIGEFQVPSANHQGNSVAMDASVRTAMEGQAFIQQNLPPPAAANLPPGMMQVNPGGPYGIPSGPNGYPYGFFPGLSGPFNPVPTSMPMTIHPGFIQQPVQYPYYPSVTATTTALVTASAALPGLRNVLPPNALFQQPLLSNVVVTQAAAIAQAQTRFQMMTGVPGMQPHPLQLQMAQLHGQGHHLHHLYPAMGHALHPLPPPPVQPMQQLSQRQLTLLLSAYRVGMLAMETLARRVHDDRPQTKYARNPSYGEDVKWLLGVAKKLGMFSDRMFFIQLC